MLVWKSTAQGWVFNASVDWVLVFRAYQNCLDILSDEIALI